MASLLFALLFAYTLAEKCTNPSVRREWSELNSSEKSQFVNSIFELTTRPISGQVRDPGIISYDDFVQTHVKNAIWTHGNAQFYPYHRALMHQFDLAMKSVGWTGGVVYWDWPAVSQNWHASDVFDYFGAYKSNDTDNCVLDGPFKKDEYTIAPDLTEFDRPVAAGGDRTCLRRCGQNAVLTDATVITSMMANATNYVEFRGDDTTNYHAIGHTVLGGFDCGDMANGLFSTNDPLFFLHHGLVDKIWWRWQQLCPEFKTDYEGTLISAKDPTSDGKTANASASLQMDSWYWWTVEDVLDTEGDLLCYTYSKSAGDLELSLNDGLKCPSESQPSQRSESREFLDQWLHQGLEYLVQSDFMRTDSKVARREVRSQSTFDTEENADGTNTVHYLANGKKIDIPGGYKVHKVFESNVQAVSTSNGRPKMFYETKPTVAYQKIPCANDFNIVGSPCYLEKPPRVREETAISMNMHWQQVQSNDNLTAMKIDELNCKCIAHNKNSLH